MEIDSSSHVSLLCRLAKHFQFTLLVAATASAPSLALAQSPNSWSPEPFAPPANLRPLSSANESPISSQISTGIPSNRLRGEASSLSENSMNATANQPVVARWKSIKSKAIEQTAEATQNTVFQSQSDRIADGRAQSGSRGIDEAPSVSRKSRQVSQRSSYNDNSASNQVRLAGVWSNRDLPQSASSQVQTAAYQDGREITEAPSLQEPGFSIPFLPEAIAPNDVESFPPFQSPKAPSVIEAIPQDANANQLRAQDGASSTRSLLEPSQKQAAPSPFLPPRNDDKFGSPSDQDLPPQSRAERPRGSKQTPPNSKGSKKLAVDCDDVRSRAVATDISAITLNVAPVFGVGPKDKASVEEKRNKFAGSAPTRQWYDYTGRPLADGRLVDLANDSIIVESSTGERLALSIRELSDADTVYVSESWGLPVTCSLGDQTLVARAYEPSTVAWKASGLCHKPLYFEEIQLERSGHEWGPIVQPALSTAHFFKNVAFLPYKMAINPMNECQYALGHYRPGSCAPWSIEPIPLSLRGLAGEGAAIGGAALILP